MAVIVAQFFEYAKNHYIVHFKRMNFMACELSQYKKLAKIFHQEQAFETFYIQ